MAKLECPRGYGTVEWKESNKTEICPISGSYSCIKCDAPLRVDYLNKEKKVSNRKIIQPEEDGVI